jgi:hypothetical protein
MPTRDIVFHSRSSTAKLPKAGPAAIQINIRSPHRAALTEKRQPREAAVADARLNRDASARNVAVRMNGSPEIHSKAMGYLLWIFGFTGSHRFYYGKPISVTIWFFTGGLFLIGWIGIMLMKGQI